MSEIISVTEEEVDQMFGETPPATKEEGETINNPPTDPDPDSIVVEGDVKEQDREAGTTEEGTPIESEGEVIEIPEEEAKHLLSQDPEYLVAWGVKHRKGFNKLQSRVDKISNVLGDGFIKAVEQGEVPREVGLLYQNIHDGAFQSHIAEFFDAYQLKEGRYHRTKDKTPTPDLLKEYGDLIAEKASLNIESFLQEPPDNDPNWEPTRKDEMEAMSKYHGKVLEIDKRIDEIHNTSVSNQLEPVSPGDKAKLAKKSMDAVVGTHPELKDERAMNEFKGFVSDNANNLLEVMFAAFKAKSNGNQNMRRLVLKEIGKIEDNKGSTKEPPKSKQTKSDYSKFVADDVGNIKADDEYFGD